MCVALVGQPIIYQSSKGRFNRPFLASRAYGSSKFLKVWFQHHFNIEIMVNCSAKIVFNKQRIRQDGSVLLYLRVIIGGQRKDIDLKVHWQLNKFDKKKQRCLPLEKSCQKHTDMNIILSDAEAKASEIFVQYRLRRLDLTLEIFLKEYNTNLNKNDFLAYMEAKMNERLRLGEITAATVKSQTVTLNHLKAWKSPLLFCDINNRTAQAFDSFLLRKTGSKKKNARWGQHKNFKTYLNQARKKDNVQFTNPYDFFKVSSEPGRFQPLSKDQFIQFYEYYDEPLIDPTQKIILRAFLFGCFTGMRHSDIRLFSLDWIDGEFMEFVPFKTRRFGTKVRLPLTKEAMAMIADELEEASNPNKLFRKFAEQTDNDIIHEIAKLLEIKMKLCFQIARETFATLYMEHDGKLEVLAAFMGHMTTKMTEKYIKIMDQRRKSEGIRISNFTKTDY